MKLWDTPEECMAWLRARTEEEGDCLIWTGYVPKRRRTPIANIKNKGGIAVRRAIYERMRGPLKKNFVITAKCDADLCCHPEHLSQVSKGYILSKSYESGAMRTPESYLRQVRNAAYTGKKLLGWETAALIRQRRASGESAAKIARDLGVWPETVCAIVNGETYRNVGTSVFSWFTRKA